MCDEQSVWIAMLLLFGIIGVGNLIAYAPEIARALLRSA